MDSSTEKKPKYRLGEASKNPTSSKIIDSDSQEENEAPMTIEAIFLCLLEL